MATPPTDAASGLRRRGDAGAEFAVTIGVASLAVRDLLRGTRRHGKVLAVLPHAIYLEFADTVPEPRVIAVSPPDAIRLPNAIITGPWEALSPLPVKHRGMLGGGGWVMACGLDIRIVRWWDPSPVFGPLSRARLDHGAGVLASLYAAAEHAPGLAGHDGPGQLAARWRAATWPAWSRQPSAWWALAPGWCRVATAWSAACRSRCACWAGPSPAERRAVWLANWLSASVTCDAAQRTTTLAASLLHCAAKGQAAAEVSAVLLAMAGQEPLERAASRLLAAPQGVDLAWGLVAGCRAALLLSVS